MYNKIYRNMLFLIALTLCITLITVLLGIFTVFTDAAVDSLSEKAINTAALLDNAKSRQELLQNLQSTDSVFTYDISAEKEVYSAPTEKYFAIAKLANGDSLIVTLPKSAVYSKLYLPYFFIIIIAVFIYFLLIRLASAMAKSIVMPFEDVFATEDPYDEILPLTRAIEFQTKEIKRQTENAHAREKELQLITDNINEGLITVNETGNILSVNNFALKLFSVGYYDAIHKHFSKLYSGNEFSSAVYKALDGSRSNTIIELGDSVYRVYCSPILREKLFCGAIILIFDITSTYRSEKLRREFSANVSHELKTPLTSINGYAQLITGGIAKPEDIPEFAGKIAKESNRLMILIEDIMRLSNLDEGSPSEPSEEVSVMEVIDETVSFLREKAEKRNISISVIGADFMVTANRSQLGELIYNICDNAIKYNRDGGKVTINLSDKSISVSDTGIGISPEYTERIFERFFRVDKSHSKKVDGTGLGLSIVKHIAKLNNIEITVKSKLGEGSTFTIHF